MAGLQYLGMQYNVEDSINLSGTSYMARATVAATWEKLNFFPNLSPTESDDIILKRANDRH